MTSDFAGTERFRVRKQLGSGAMGEVYEAWDRQREAAVALKVLRHADAEGIVRFKQEFRTLADVAHPNLVGLHDLVADGERWFFTMELIAGRPLTEALWGRAPLAMAASLPQPSLHRTLVSTQSPGVQVAPPAPASSSLEPPALDADRLRRLLVQLVDAVSCMHRLGILHRDLKPSNVLVTDADRLVVLDFGLARSMEDSDGEEIAGTPAYMAPEQAAGEFLTEAADWYAVGAMLFECLVGRVPFSGDVRQVLWEKQTEAAPDPRDLRPNLPSDLATLARDLLQRDPTLRPGVGDIGARLRLGTLAVIPSLRNAASSRPRAARAQPLVGRKGELAWLWERLRQSRQGQAVVVLCEGDEGVGKSALLEAFRGELSKDPECIVLSTRCHPRERIPHNLFDGWIDDLGRVLRQTPKVRAEGWLPRNLTALERLFPAFRPRDFLGTLERCGRYEPGDELAACRAWGADALVDLLGRVADAAPLILLADDLDFADADSRQLLAALLRAVSPPALLLVATRPAGRRFSVEEFGAPALTETDAVPGSGGTLWFTRCLAPLGAESSHGLALELLGGCDDAAWRLASEVARAAQGNPRRIEEITTFYRRALEEDIEWKGVPDAAAVASATWSSLGAAERSVVRALALAVAPLPLAALRSVAVELDEVDEVLRQLEEKRLTRSVHRRTGLRVELVAGTFQDWVRQSFDAAETQRLHSALARALDDGESALQGARLEHLRLAGEHEALARTAYAAAEEAAAATALERAVELLCVARDAAPPGLLPDVGLKLGELLVATGRIAEAVEVLSAAAADASPIQSARLAKQVLELRLRLQRSQENHAAARVQHSDALFQGLGNEGLSHLMETCQVLQASDGETICSPEEVADSLLVLLSGRMLARSGEVSFEVEEGTVVGETSFLLGLARGVTLEALGADVRVLLITRAGLDGLGQAHPRDATQLLLNLARSVAGKAAQLRRR